MKNALSMLVDVAVNSTDVYQKDFEKDFLIQTRTYYQTESQAYLTSWNVTSVSSRIIDMRYDERHMYPIVSYPILSIDLIIPSCHVISSHYSLIFPI